MGATPQARATREAEAAIAAGETAALLPVKPPLARLRARVPMAVWKKMQPVEKGLVIVNMSYDQAFHYLSWDPDYLDAHRLSAQKEIVRAMLYAVTKAGIDRGRDQARVEQLEDFARRLEARQQPRSGAKGERAGADQKIPPSRKP
jgi:hypothetical protein